MIDLEKRYYVVPEEVWFRHDHSEPLLKGSVAVDLYQRISTLFAQPTEPFGSLGGLIEDELKHD